MSPRLIAGLLLLVLALAASAPAATAQETAGPSVRAASHIVIDARNGEVLSEEDADDRRSIASATKLMTALLALERADLDDVFTAPAYRALPVESKINLRKGERMTVRDLLKALLLESANDAAVTIAENVSGSRAAFVRDMNARARELGLRNTRYANPIGLDHPRNYSTARDLATLAQRLRRDPTFARIVDSAEATLTSGSHRRTIRNRNRLVGRYDFVNGVKTGYTRRAGYVLVGSATGRGVPVISVVLGDPSEAARDTDTVALLRYGLDQFRRKPVLMAGEPVAHASVRWFGDDRRAALTTPGDVAVTVRRGEEVRTSIDAPRELEGPLPAGERVGTARVVYRGKVVEVVPLVTAGEVPDAGVLRRLTSALGTILTVMLVGAVLLAATLVGLRVRAVRLRRARMSTGTR